MLFAVLLGIHIKIRKYCHPFFGSLFGSILFCYILCDIAEGVCQFLFIFNFGNSALEVVYMIYDLTYAAVTPLAFCCLIGEQDVDHDFIHPIHRKIHRNHVGGLLRNQP